jgi:hypothetical protein
MFLSMGVLEAAETTRSLVAPTTAVIPELVAPTAPVRAFEIPSRTCPALYNTFRSNVYSISNITALYTYFKYSFSTTQFFILGQNWTK